MAFPTEERDLAPRRTAWIASAAVVLALLPAARARAEGSAAESLLAARSSSVVTLKYVLRRTWGGGGHDEHRRQIPGAIVHPTGLVMLSAYLLDARSGATWKAVAEDLRVVFGADPTEHPAVLVAQDSDIDLAYVQILDLADHPAPAPALVVDLWAGAAVHVGEPLVGVARKSAAFDFAPCFRTAYVTARLEKPHPVWGLGGDELTPGLPVFDLAGSPVGVHQLVSDVGTEDDGTAPKMRSFLVPLPAVRWSVTGALARVPSAIEKARGGTGGGTPVPEAPPPTAPTVPPAHDGPGLPDRGDGTTLEQHLARWAPSIVCVKAVAAVHATVGKNSYDLVQKVELRGAVVDASGLVMVYDGSNLVRALERRLSGASIHVTPTNIQVLFGSEAKEHDAVLVAHDSALGLAFVQILDLAGASPVAVDLSASGEPGVGRRLFGVSRLPRAFDCAPEIHRLYASMRLVEPRPSWGVAGDFSGAGLPVFDMAGKPVGVLVYGEGAEETSKITLRVGLPTDMLLLPMSAIVKSLEAARKLVPDALAKARAAPSDAERPGDSK